MMAGARANITGYKDSFAITIADSPVKIVHSFRWQGVAWTWEEILLRILWVGAALALVLLAALVFDRFDSSRSLAPSWRRPKQAAAAHDAIANSSTAEAPRQSPTTRAPAHLTPLAASGRTHAFGRLVLAELRLTVKGMRWWWYAVAAGLLIAQFAAPLDASRGPILGSAWMWLVLVWSGMGARESRFGTRALLFRRRGFCRGNYRRAGLREWRLLRSRAPAPVHDYLSRAVCMVWCLGSRVPCFFPRWRWRWESGAAAASPSRWWSRRSGMLFR